MSVSLFDTLYVDRKAHETTWRSRSQPSPKAGGGEEGGRGLLDQHLVIGEPLRSFEMIRIRISDLRSQDHGRSNEPMNPCPVDSSVHLIYHDPSALGSLILIRIISKERTLKVRYLGKSVSRLGKHQDSRENKTNCFPRDLTLSVLNI